MSTNPRERSQKSEEASPASSKGPGRPRDEDKDRAIVTAAQHMFLERGYDGASVDAIADRAGVAKATVYKRFPDKETLLRQSIMSKCAEFLDGETLDWRPEKDFRQGLIAISRRFLSLIMDPQALAMHRLIMQEGQRAPQLPTLFFESAIVPTVEKLERYLLSEAARGGIDMKDSTQASWRYLGMVKGEDHMRAMLGVAPRSKKEIEAHIAACADDFIRAHRTG